MKEITAQELKNWIANKHDFQLIDIRESYEIELNSMGGEHIPMGDIMQNIDKISRTKPVVIHCRSGARSAAIINVLNTHGFTNLLNLKGGILAFIEE